MAAYTLACLGLMAAPAAAGGSRWEFDAESYQAGDQAFAWAQVSWEHSSDLGTPDDGPFHAFISRTLPAGPQPPILPADATAVASVEISLQPYDAGGVLFGPHHATVSFTVPQLSAGTYSLWHCDSPCTTTLGDIVPATFTVGRVGPLVVSRGPAVSLKQGRWTLRPKEEAGLGQSTSFNAVASSGDAALLAGSRPVGDARAEAAIWRSIDGVHWSDTKHPSDPGVVTAIGIDGDVALAIGGDGLGVSDFVWRSQDGGVSWTSEATGDDLFGVPAPEMGRPNVSGLLRHRGWWIASGGRADGYAAIWVSRDGANWRQVLGSNAAGSATVVKGADGALLAYWGTSIWSAKNPTKWSAPQNASIPGRRYLSSVAAGGTVAVGDNVDRHGQPTPLLRSTDGGLTWTEDEHFLAQFPAAAVWTLTRDGNRWIAAGWSEDHVDAWIWAPRRRWEALPENLYGANGGTLSLVATVDGRVVLIGTAPELDRYYTYELDGVAPRGVEGGRGGVGAIDLDAASDRRGPLRFVLPAKSQV